MADTNLVQTWDCHFDAKEMKLVLKALLGKLDESELLPAEALGRQLINLRAKHLGSLHEGNQRFIEKLLAE